MDRSVDNDKESSPNQHKAEEKSGEEDGISSAKRAHPLYKQLSLISGEINSYSLEELRARLHKLKLNDRGIQEVLVKRLKQHLRMQAIAEDPSAPQELRKQLQTNPLGLDYLLILDFEATCQEVNPPEFIHEIIEFPVLMLNIKTLKIEDEFHSYCKPQISPLLSKFCTTLTGIQQWQVDLAPPFPVVLRSFHRWLQWKKLGSQYKYSLVTDCPWDIKECFFPQCAFASVQFPDYAAKWVDMRKMFASFYQVHNGNISFMLECLDMEFEGREHCGKDDAHNISRIVCQMIKDGCVIHQNRLIPKDIIDKIFKRK